MTTRLRVLELFCGIGGCAAALGERAEVIAAVDIDRDALKIYGRNFPHPALPLTIESIPEAAWRGWRADLWWLSPPCQPYTVRGRRRDLDDSRADSFKVVLRQLDAMQPRYVALENVPMFAGSRAHELLRAMLERRNYRIAERLLCPTELGIPNRRQRFYLVAALDDLAPWPTGKRPTQQLREFLEPHPPPETLVAPTLVERYAGALDIVRAEDASAVAACFTSAYGKSPVRSGSYLDTGDAVRRFTPCEILRLLGFPPDFLIPDEFSLRRCWSLVGNSLSVPAVRWVLSAIPSWSYGEATNGIVKQR